MKKINFFNNRFYYFLKRLVRRLRTPRLQEYYSDFSAIVLRGKLGQKLNLGGLDFIIFITLPSS